SRSSPQMAPYGGLPGAFKRAWKLVDELATRGYARNMSYTGSSGHGSSVARARRELHAMGRTGRRQSAVDRPGVRVWGPRLVCGAEKGGGPVQRHFMVISEVVAP